MQKKWYIVYTKVISEKNLAALLTEKKIENYCPLNRITVYEGNEMKISFEPLFPSFVFVYITDAEIIIIRKIGAVTNFIYWLQNPVIIRDAEIENIKRFTYQYSNVKLSKSPINNNGILRIINKAHFEITDESRVISIKNVTCKLLISSIGYVMTAETERTANDISLYGTYAS